MKTARLEDMVKGWFVGAFSPTAHQTNDCEVAVKFYKAGDYEPPHFHKVATEITVVISGQVKMTEKIFEAGSIIVMEPNESTDFLAITDTINVVVKVPGVLNDKYGLNEK